MDTQLQVYDKIKSMPEIQEFGNAIALSGMFGCTRPEQGIVFAIQCMHERKPPLEMAKTYHVVGDKLVKRSDAMLADFRRAGGKWRWKDLDSTDIAQATVEWEDAEYNVSYTIEQAQQAGLVKDKSNWVKDPATMLRARCVSRTLRAIAPEIVQGVYTEEDLSAEPAQEPRNITPEQAQEKLEKQADRQTSTGKPAAASAKATKSAKEDPFVEVEAEDVAEDKPSGKSGGEADSDTEPPVDYTIIPIGANVGKRWSDLDKDTLEKVIANPRTLSPGHIRAAKYALENTPF
jgi:hypothetical protein